MTLTKRSKPALAKWIVEERKRLGLKPDSLAAELTRLGYEVKEPTVRGWEAGARPGAGRHSHAGAIVRLRGSARDGRRPTRSGSSDQRPG